jgi:hypothetical protein
MPEVFQATNTIIRTGSLRRRANCPTPDLRDPLAHLIVAPRNPGSHCLRRPFISHEFHHRIGRLRGRAAQSSDATRWSAANAPTAPPMIKPITVIHTFNDNLIAI